MFPIFGTVHRSEEFLVHEMPETGFSPIGALVW